MCGIFLTNTHSEKHENIKSRGPNQKRIIKIKDLKFVFYRLPINDLSENGMQPFVYKDIILMCNGEIFNHKLLEKTINKRDLISNSDCEIIIHLYKKYGGGNFAIEKICKEIDGEYAFILYDCTRETVFMARDNFGVRPLFYKIKNNKFYICSEIKGIELDDDTNNNVKPFPPGNYGYIKNFNNPECTLKKYYSINLDKNHHINANTNYNDIHTNIRNLLKTSVHNRIMSDQPIGAFLSGGLDSSLICALLQETKNLSNLQCFSIGLNESSADIIAAKKVAKFIGIKEENHHCVYFTIEEGLNCIKDVIYATETYDITTIRASVPQYILCKWIKKNTNIKVLFSGEFADELFCGYMYSKLAPNSTILEKDSKRLLEEIYLYDALRVDRTVGSFGLECRIPFSDKKLVDYIFSLSPTLRMCKDTKEKTLLRDSFKNENLLPDDILYRKKEAFSDAVGSKEECWYKSLQSLIELLVSEEELKEFQSINSNVITKEAVYYKKIFNEFYKGCENVIPKYWMPKWCDVLDPSATVLNCYKNSD